MHRWHIQYLGSTELPSHLTDLEMESFFGVHLFFVQFTTVGGESVRFGGVSGGGLNGCVIGCKSGTNAESHPATCRR